MKTIDEILAMSCREFSEYYHSLSEKEQKATVDMLELSLKNLIARWSK